jgi:hypothetical protein
VGTCLFFSVSVLFPPLCSYGRSHALFPMSRFALLSSLHTMSMRNVSDRCVCPPWYVLEGTRAWRRSTAAGARAPTAIIVVRERSFVALAGANNAPTPVGAAGLRKATPTSVVLAARSPVLMPSVGAAVVSRRGHKSLLREGHIQRGGPNQDKFTRRLFYFFGFITLVCLYTQDRSKVKL